MSESEPSDVYRSLLTSIHHLENRAALGLYNFLMGSSILVLAWAALFAANESAGKSMVLIAISILGVFSGLLWALLGVRAWHYALEYADQLRNIWAANTAFAPYLAVQQAVRGHWLMVDEAPQTGWTRKVRWVLGISANHRVLFAVPMGFSVLHMVMLTSVMCCVDGGFRASYGLWASVVVVWVLFAIAAWMVWWQCWPVLKK